MIVRWRSEGEPMGTIDLRRLEGDHVVIHYGGALNSVDAYTFANSLIAFADAIRSVSDVLDPGPRVEIRLEALSRGSFRAKIRRIPTRLGQIFREQTKEIIYATIACLILDLLRGPPASNEIIINSDEVIITRGEDKIIVPRKAYEGCEKLKYDPKIQNSISRTFRVIEADDAIENFGITPREEDIEPLLQVSRKEFPRLAESPYLTLPESPPGRRERIEPATLVILKAWLDVSSTRKWSFEWNGVPISAPIKDIDFLKRLARREHLIGYGDALTVELRYLQDYDEKLGIYVNDQRTFEVLKVERIIQRETPLDPFIE